MAVTLEEICSQTTVSDFFKNVSISSSIMDCWIWTKSVAERNVPSMFFKGIPISSSKVSWILHNQVLVPEGLIVIRLCYESKCVNPFHHMVGSPADCGKVRKIKGVSCRNTIEGFWEKVNKDGLIKPHMATSCWIWTGYKDNGYGTFYFKGVYWSTHRFSWYLCNGEIPKGGFICHHCDTPSCVRPDHLYVGDHKSNLDDAVKRGLLRGKPGESNPMYGRKGKELNPTWGYKNSRSKFSEEDLKEVRKMLFQDKIHYSIIAKIKNVHPETIRRILKGETYKEDSND